MKLSLCLITLLTVAPMFAMDNHNDTSNNAQSRPVSSPQFPPTLYDSYYSQQGAHQIDWRNQFPDFHYDSDSAPVAVRSASSTPSFVGSGNSSSAYVMHSPWSVSSIGSPASTASSSLPDPHNRALRWSKPVVGQSLAIPTVKQQIAAIQAAAARDNARIQAAVAQENARRMQALNAIMAQGQLRIEHSNNMQWSYK